MELEGRRFKMGVFGCEYEGTISFLRRKYAESMLRCVAKMLVNK
jgi:hypothetical protein